MKIPLRIFLYILFLIVVAGLAWYYGKRSSMMEVHSQSNTHVLLERMNDVQKLVSVEGHFSEIYDYKDYYIYDISPFRKKALIRVKATVLAGFDMDSMTVEIDSVYRVLKISRFPEASILSIDHDLDYYDIQEGSFNQFDEAKLNELNSGAKDFIRQQALESGLLGRAEQRKLDFVQSIQTQAEAMGWTVEVEISELKK